MPASVVGDLPSLTVSELYARGQPREGVVLERQARTAQGRFDFSIWASEEVVTTAVLWQPVAEGEPERFERVAGVEWRVWRFDSRRAYIWCTGCGTPSMRLFVSLGPLAGSLLCRKCAGPSARYRSQNATRRERLVAGIDKIRERLGDEAARGELGLPVPDRPRGMHERTYVRLVAELRDLESELEDECTRLLWVGLERQHAFLERMAVRVDRITRRRQG